jgi:hypothetical protein
MNFEGTSQRRGNVKRHRPDRAIETTSCANPKSTCATSAHEIDAGLIAHNPRPPIEFSAIKVLVIEMAGTIAELPTGGGNLK